MSKISHILRKLAKIGANTGKSASNWVDKKTGTPVAVLCELKDHKFGYSADGVMLYPIVKKEW